MGDESRNDHAPTVKPCDLRQIISKTTGLNAGGVSIMLTKSVKKASNSKLVIIFIIIDEDRRG